MQLDQTTSLLIKVRNYLASIQPEERDRFITGLVLDFAHGTNTVPANYFRDSKQNELTVRNR